MAKHKTPEQYTNVLNIPEGAGGDFRIKHVRFPAGHTLSINNLRTAVIGGDPIGRVTFKYPTRWHELLEGDGRWMSDYPIEQVQHDRELESMRSGRVLVGGLGLGYAATQLARRARIREVVVVEKSQDVINLVADHLLMQPGDERARAKLTVVHADLFDYLREQRSKDFDHAFYDIWAGDGERTFFFTVMPLRVLSSACVKRNPVCWNENVMRGQLFNSLHSRMFMLRLSAENRARIGITDDDNATFERLTTYHDVIWHDWAVPFFRWLQEHQDASEKIIEEKAALYAGQFGRREFPHVWEILTGMPHGDWNHVITKHFTRQPQEA